MKELTREDFIKNTGIFITHNYFNVMILTDFKESGLSPAEFCKQWYADNSAITEEIELKGTIKYVIDDDDLTHLSWDSAKEDNDDLTASDLLDYLSESAHAYKVRYEELRKEMDNIKNGIEKIQLKNTVVQDSVLEISSAVNPMKKPQARYLS